LLVTADEDAAARVWDADTGELVAPPLKHGQYLTTVRFGSKRRVLTACADGTVRVWDLLPENRPVRALQDLASLLSGRRIDPAGGLTPLEPETLRQLHRQLCKTFPDLLSLERP
jgi:hypothetical protein